MCLDLLQKDEGSFDICGANWEDVREVRKQSEEDLQFVDKRCGWVGRDVVWVSAGDEEKPLWWLWRKVDVRVVLCSLQSRGVVWLRPAGSEGLCPGRHVWRSLLEPAPLRTPCVDCRHLGSDVVQTLLSPSCLTSHTSYTWYVGLGKGLLPSHMGTRPLAGVRHAPYLRPVSGHLPACMSWGPYHRCANVCYIVPTWSSCVVRGLGWAIGAFGTSLVRVVG